MRPCTGENACCLWVDHIFRPACTCDHVHGFCTDKGRFSSSRTGEMRAILIEDAGRRGQVTVFATSEHLPRWSGDLFFGGWVASVGNLWLGCDAHRWDGESVLVSEVLPEECRREMCECLLMVLMQMSVADVLAMEWWVGFVFVNCGLDHDGT